MCPTVVGAVRLMPLTVCAEKSAAGNLPNLLIKYCLVLALLVVLVWKNDSDKKIFEGIKIDWLSRRSEIMY